jgi:hypothetical protein
VPTSGEPRRAAIVRGTVDRHEDTAAASVARDTGSSGGGGGVGDDGGDAGDGVTNGWPEILAEAVVDIFYHVSTPKYVPLGRWYLSTYVGT